MLAIEQIILREIRLPLVEPFQISSGTTTERRILLVELIDASGATLFDSVWRREKRATSS